MNLTERTQFEEAVGVTRTTINRWIRGEKGWPRPDNVKRLLAILTEEQQQEFLVLARKDPEFWEQLHATVSEEPANLPPLPPKWLDSFCYRLLRLQRDTPKPYRQLTGAILKEALTRLESHPNTGLEIIVATCMPPKDGKVRSLRASVGMGTSPWPDHQHTLNSLMGIESLAGYVVTKGHGEVIADLSDSSSLQLQVERATDAGSAAAFPILTQTHGTAGALLALSTQKNFFTEERITMLEIFADTIRLAFSETQFMSCIELGVLPPWDVQHTYFDSFRRRVNDAHQKALREGASPIHSEEQVFAQIEYELLQAGDRMEVHF
ncbi:hypothetical protein KSF_109490 [Reticulibacter mediterranei]|uniref:HTH cro/C1-type domain-containing protein n=2 Tax=Reticulibacter mediterranei TaxID=2778369 RepID=A0A8J3IU61_9CHLR|nr:hypothetical protein KSF_109490 [Reticulibacter mediterranei]